MKDHFRIAGMSTVYHTKETKQVFEKYIIDGLTVSDFGRCAINTYANHVGYNGEAIEISVERLDEIKRFERTSKKVNYDYLRIFEWLKLQFPMATASNLVRMAIVNYSPESP